MTRSVKPWLSEGHFVSGSCVGERCAVCREPATHKIGEEIPHDHPHRDRHNFTAYVCCAEFVRLLGPWAAEYSGCAVPSKKAGGAA